jgi:hypothetical protein
MVIVIVSELQQLSFEICRTPEWNLIQKFSPQSCRRLSKPTSSVRRNCSGWMERNIEAS